MMKLVRLTHSNRLYYYYYYY